MYKLTENPNVVIRLIDGARIPRGHPWWRDYEEWLRAGNTAEPVLSLDEIRSQKRQLINRLRDQKVSDGVQVGNRRWDTNPASQTKIMAAVTMITAGQALPPGFTWTDADDNDVPMDDQQIVALGAALFRHLRLIHIKARQHKRALNDAADPSEYDVEGGW